MQGSRSKSAISVALAPLKELVFKIFESHKNDVEVLERFRFITFGCIEDKQKIFSYSMWQGYINKRTNISFKILFVALCALGYTIKFKSSHKRCDVSRINQHSDCSIIYAFMYGILATYLDTCDCTTSDIKNKLLLNSNQIAAIRYRRADYTVSIERLIFAIREAGMSLDIEILKNDFVVCDESRILNHTHTIEKVCLLKSQLYNKIKSHSTDVRRNVNSSLYSGVCESSSLDDLVECAYMFGIDVSFCFSSKDKMPKENVGGNIDLLERVC